MENRTARLRALMHAQRIPALLVSKRENVLYLSGFSGSSGALLVTPDAQWLITDFRYFTQAETQAPAWTLWRVDPATTYTAAYQQALAACGAPVIGFDADDLSVTLWRALGGDDPQAPYRLQPAAGLVETLRLVKDAGELAVIREAVRITDGACAHLIALAKPGVTERELALEAEWYMRRHGAQAAAFDTIVAGGPHSALPHAEPGDRPLRAGDLLIIDMGARYRHYCADMTRTVAIGHATPEAREIYRVCWQAQAAGLAGLRAGLTGREADALTREVITAAGYGEQFGHGTGHGVGIEVHEAPRLSRTAEAVIPAGAVVTVEPGIYLPGVGGVRIEDLVVTRDNDVEILTGAPKPAELPIVG